MTAESHRPARRGLMLILSSPSGAGKTTLTRNLKSENNLDLSISVTTRTRRPSEIDGVHYRFIDRGTFDAMRQHNDLLEWAEVHGNGYGTPRKEVEASLAAGRDVLFDIDWQGTQQIVKKARADVVTIFILPPSMAELRSRLVRRAEDAPDVIAKRLANARDEIARWSQYDYVIINDDLDAAYDAIKAILTAERLKRSRAVGLGDFVDQLLAEELA
ncbi:MAG: guanylate kinase [Bosea sp.]|uniref:guanylate kinase n=1 Tax=unclassified Bosea (in: a-proteobacteria) TaxID=2653178 RepID=UPI0009695C4D|nr:MULTISPECIES: guanylate kinase [unclassified Bosea (in: a-proteobacteria)]MBN9443157.1 guanylate kinase [Bosea sp. (in: a-proteobacteria)]MBN9457160.1 guanylate kinase [Bosea sp. (in: a-proteobacteria)]OJV09825.1 MAG: guanylate kinase [Bosea sp. 67-29]